ncbi:MAG: molybdopterin molybdenumtransferase MoeA [Clostridia bacterium]|nr:molybdopterin molybdenumtransferase MoeA [Clostridia bacterium]
MLKVMSLDKARTMLMGELERLLLERRASDGVFGETVGLSEASGRILVEAIVAPYDVPSFDRSQVDGLAVRSADTFGASEALPAILNWAGEVAMGQAATQPLVAGACFGVATGGMLPPRADAMVMIEDVEQIDAETRLVTRSVSPGSHVTRRGDDTRAGQVVLPAGRCLKAPEIGALAALGLSQVGVVPRVRVGILSTGDELVAAGQTHPNHVPGSLNESVRPVLALPGTVYDANGPMLAAAIREAHALPVEFGIVRDQLDELSATLQAALDQSDLVLISGGSSAGARDYVERAIAAAGQPGVLLHGLAVKPGKPTVAGICQGKLVIGLPGHPVAAWFIFEQLVRPLLAALGGREPVARPKVRARITSRIPSNHGREEFVLVRLLNRAEQPIAWLAEPLPTRSGLITQLSSSDGYLVIDRDSEGLESGSEVVVTLLHDPGEVMVGRTEGGSLWNKPI